jgi:hypothetical protein
MRKKLILLLIIIIGLGLVFWISERNGNNDNPEQAKVEAVTGFGNEQMEQAIIEYLLTQETLAWKTKEDTRNYCGVRNLGDKEDLFPLSLWVFCGEYRFENGDLEELSGYSGPIKLSYPNELSFYDIDKFDFEAPGDGSSYAQDIGRIFPEEVRQIIYEFEVASLKAEVEDRAREELSD